MASGDIIFSDPFTEASTDTELNSHAPATGTSWTRIHQTGSETIKAVAASDTARATAQSLSKGAAYTADGSYPSADYHVLSTFTGVTTSSGDEQRLYIRYAAQAADGYYAVSPVNSTASPTIIVKGSGASSETILRSVEYDTSRLVNGTVILLEAIGSDIALFEGEVCVELYVSDSAVTAAGKAALGMGAFWADTGGDTNSDMINDDFQVIAVGANNTGWLNPTTTGENTNDFTNPSNAYSSNNTDATRQLTSANTYYSQDYGDFSINTSAANATGIQVFLECAVDDNSGQTYTLRMELSKDNGASWVTSKTITGHDWVEAVNVDTFFIFGHARSLWGQTWTPTDLDNDHFRIRFSAQSSVTLKNIAVDHIKVRVFYDAPAVSAAVTGTITPTATEADIVAGGKTIIITLTGDTWVTAGATFDAQRQNIIDGLDAAASPAGGWNAEVQGNANVTDVVRTSNTVVTITLEAFGSYDISSTETITVTVPGSALTGGNPLTGSPTFTVTAVGSAILKDIIGFLGIIPFAR